MRMLFPSLSIRPAPLLLAFLAVFSQVASAEDWVNKVDAWEKTCDESVCTLSIYKDMKEAKGESDYFALGLRVFRESGKPDYFVFSVPPQVHSSQIILSFQDLEVKPPKLISREITSFQMKPCPSRKECKIFFPSAIITPNFDSDFKPLDMWETFHVRQLLLVLMVSKIDGVRVERSALISLPAFRHVASELLKNR